MCERLRKAVKVCDGSEKGCRLADGGERLARTLQITLFFRKEGRERRAWAQLLMAPGSWAFLLIWICVMLIPELRYQAHQLGQDFDFKASSHLPLN